MTVICFDSVLQRKYQERLEADEDLQRRRREARERIERELLVQFMAGANGANVQLPFVRVMTGKRVTQPFAEAAMDAIDYAEVLQQFMAVLRESECQHVIALKRLMAERYALANAGDLAEIEVPE